jgi:RNA polymerase sigma-70 factor (ECF subfamily)
MVCVAGRDATPESRRALAELCESYWFPLYAFVRRKGYQAAEAQDLTQAFFAELLEKDRLQLADPARGRFRSFLLASLQNYLTNQFRRARAIKRGGDRRQLPLDFAGGEARYLREPCHDETPERIFERRWATALLDKAVGRLREEYAERGKLLLYERLVPHLGGDVGASYDEIGLELGMTEGAIKVAAHRLRQRCRELLREEIAQTVASPEEVDEELLALFQAVDTSL